MRRSDDQHQPSVGELGPVLSSLLSVATIADLAALTYGDGTGIYVRSVRDYWVYRSGSTATADAITVVAHSSGAGRWERLNIPHPSWDTQADWYLDGTSGLDEALGSVGSPIKTPSELVRRLGFIYAPKINHQVYLTAGTYTLWTWRLIGGGGGNVYINGTLTVGTTSTVTSSTAQAPATNVDPKMVIAGITPATEVGRMLLSGTAVAWASEAGGANEVYTSTWCSLALGAVSETTPGGQATVPANGAAITSYTHGTILSAPNFDVTNGDGVLVINDCRIQDAARFSSTGCSVYIRRSDINGNGNFFFAGGSYYLNACRIRGSGANAFFGNLTFTRAFINNGFGDTDLSATTAGAFVTFRSDTLWHGTLGSCTQWSEWFLDSLRVRNLAGTTPVVSTAGPNASVRVNGRWWGTVTTTGPLIAFGRGNKASVTTAASGATWSIARGAGSDFTFGANTTAPAFDATTGLYTVARNLTRALLVATIAGGGFNNGVLDPITGCGIQVQ